MKSPTLLATLVAAALASTACSKKKDDAPKAPQPTVEVKAPPPPTRPATPPPPAPAGGMFEVKDVGFATPESVLYLPDQDLFLVSNINGAPTATDDNGFISKLGPDGKVVELKWIDGGKPEVTLDAPKGMAVRAGNLYVADITRVRIYDLATGASKGSIEIAGATFLNDVAAGTDKVYVTDSGLTGELKPSGTDAVHAIDAAGVATKLASGAELKSPNGVTVVGGDVWVVTFGGNELYRVASGTKTDVTELPAGGLDGLEALADGRLLVSSWETRTVYIGKPGAGFTVLASDLESPADLGVDRKRNRVAVPLFMGNAVRFYPLP